MNSNSSHSHGKHLSQILEAHLDNDAESLDALIIGLLSATRNRLNMDIAFVSEFVAGRRLFRYVDNKQDVDIVKVGDSDPLDETYCQRIVKGELPELIPDTQEIPALQSDPITRKLSIGAYIGVPIKLSDGSIYGTFCSFRPTASQLNQRDLAFVRVFADVTSALIESNWNASTGTRELRQQIQTLLDNRGLDLVYQPIVDLKNRQTLGLEALSRVHNLAWRPDILFADAAKVGLGNALSRQALENALALLDRIPPTYFLSVNVTPEFVLSEDFHQALKHTPLHQLVLELTEHAVIQDYPAIFSALEPLRARGARIAVDDAGAGYASFRHILALKPDMIKLDRSLVRNIDNDDERQALAMAIINFANLRNYLLIAEGIETDAELRQLNGLGVGCGQGYLFCRPQPIDYFADKF